MGTITDDDDRQIRPETVAYAAALRRIADACQNAGGTQKRLAELAHVADATVSRYLRGTRLAPPTFLDVLVDYHRSCGLPSSDSDREGLRELCRLAHEASGSPAVQLRATREELGVTRRALEAARKELDATRQELVDTRGRVERADLANADATSLLHAIRTRLDDIEQRSHRLEGDLQRAQAEALTAQQRAAEAERERDLLAGRVDAQKRQLLAAKDYVYPLETELAELKDLVPRLLQQVSVLQHQNDELLTQIAGTSDAETTERYAYKTAVSGPSTQVSDAPESDRMLAEAMHLPDGKTHAASATADATNTEPSGPPPGGDDEQSPSAPDALLLSRFAHEFLDARTHGEFIAALNRLWHARNRSYLPNDVERQFVRALRGDPLSPDTQRTRDHLIEQVRRTAVEDDAVATAFDRLSGRYPHGIWKRMTYRYSGGLTPAGSLVLYAVAWIYLWLFLQPATSSFLLLATSAVNLPVAILCIYAGLNRWAGPPRVLWYLHHVVITTVLLLPWLTPTSGWPVWLPNLL